MTKLLIIGIMISSLLTVLGQTKETKNTATSEAEKVAKELARKRAKELTEPELSPEEAVVFDKIKSLKDPKAVLAELRKIADKDASAAVNFAIGVNLQKLEDHQKAISSYQLALEKMPKFHRARFNLLQAYIKLKDFAKALKVNRQLMFSTYPNKQKLYKSLGLCYLETGKFEEAEYAFKTAIAIEPEIKPLRYALLNCYLGQNKLEALNQQVSSMLKKDMGNKELWRFKIISELRQEKNHQALLSMECARRMKLLNDEFYLIMADLYFEAGHSDLALPLYQQELKRANPSIPQMINVCESYIHKGDLDAAKKIHKQLSDRKLSATDKKRLMLVSGALISASGDNVQAYGYYKKLIRDYPLDDDILFKTATLAVSMKKAAEAEQYYRRIIKMGQKSKYKALLRLSELYVDNDDYKRAATLIEQAIEIEDSPAVRRYLKEIYQMIEN